jgi:hypothetical protein
MVLNKKKEVFSLDRSIEHARDRSLYGTNSKAKKYHVLLTKHLEELKRLRKQQSKHHYKKVNVKSPSLDRDIIDCRTFAKKKEKEGCYDCASDHRRIANWLEELKIRRTLK